MSMYIEGTSQFARDTFASLIYPDLSVGLNRSVTSKKAEGRFITLAHTDLPNKDCVGGFSNFKRIFNANGYTSTGNRVYNENEANAKIKPWRRENGSACDLSIELGGASFTEITMVLVENDVFTVDSVLTYARNERKTRALLIERGLLKEEVALERAYESKRIKLEDESSLDSPSSGPARAFESKVSNLVLKSGIKNEFRSPLVNVRIPSEAEKLLNKIKSTSALSTSGLDKCFDSDGDEIDPVKANKVCKKLEYVGKARDDGAVDEAQKWKAKYDELVREASQMQSDLKIKTDSLNTAEKEIESLNKVREKEYAEAEAKYIELEEKMAHKVSKLESELASVCEINKEEQGDAREIIGEQILVSKVVFEQLMAKVTQLDNSLNDIPTKENLTNVVNYLERTMEGKLCQMKGEIKDMMDKTCEEVVKKYE